MPHSKKASNSSFTDCRRSARSAAREVISVDTRPGQSTLSAMACDGSSYIGVGTTTEPKSERISLVGANTRASRAGMPHDDIVLNPIVWNDARTEGALLRVLILRRGVQMVLSVLVGKICIG